MSDDFDDLAWMRDEDDDQTGEEDEEKFDWQQSDEQSDEQAPPPGGHLGFTTELPWMQQPTGPDAGDPDEEDSLDWLRDPVEDSESAAQTPDESLPDWLRPAETTPEDVPEIPEENVPEWLKSPSSAEELVEDEPAAEWGPNRDIFPEPLFDDAGDDLEFDPDLLRDSADIPGPTDGAPASDDVPADDIDINAVPDWLLNIDEGQESPRPPASMVDDTGQLSPDWLASGQELPDTIESGQTFDEWMIEQAERERIPDLEEQMPELDELATPGSDEEAPIDTGMLPDWFLGMEKLDTEDAPEWFSGEVPATDSLSESPITDWLSAQEPPEPEPEPEAPEMTEPEPASLFGEDIFAAMGEETVDSEDLQDYFASMGAEEESSLDDVFASLGEQPEEDAQAEMLDDDFFASLAQDSELAAAAADEQEDYDPYESEIAPAEEDVLGEDFFASLGEETAAAEQSDDEFLRSLIEGPEGLETMFGEEEPEEPLAEVAEDDQPIDINTVPDGDLLHTLGIDEPDEDSFDWFAPDTPEPEAAEADAVDWLQDLGELDESALAEPVEESPPPQEVLPEPQANIEPSGVADIDSLLESMDSELTLPDTGNLLSDDVDFDDLFSDVAFSDITIERADPETPGSLPQAPDWLTEAGATVGGISAAAILRQRDDRPLEELPDRLKKLRERGATVSGRAADPDALAGVVPDLSEVAEVAAPLVTGTGAAIVLSPDQQQRVDLLRSLTASEHALALTSARAVTDEPFLLDEDEALPERVVEVQRAAPRRRPKIDRLLIALVLAAGVILPFMTNIRIGDLPPSQFAADSRQQAVFDALNSVQPGQQVLVGVEYNPTAAAELDSMTRVLLQHILTRRAQPVVISTNPVALLRANNLLTDLGRAESPLVTALGRITPLVANEDYYVTRFLPAGEIGLRGLAMNPLPLLAYDLHGQPTGLMIPNLDNFAQVVIVAERPDDIRTWAEQIAPLVDAPVLAATGFAGEPLTEPYVGSSFEGLLVGFKDAFTYGAMLGEVSVPETVLTEEPETEAAPTEAPADSEDTADTAAEDEGTAAPQPTTEASPAPAETGVIVGNQNINVRSGPGSGFAIVTTAAPGEQVEILSRGSGWFNVRLANGDEGWVAANLVQVIETGDVADEDEPEGGFALPTDTPAPTDPPAATSTSQPTGTPVPSATPVPSSTPAPTRTPPPATPTVQPSPAPQAEVIARVVADTTINVRGGPSTSSSPVGTASPGDEFAVLGRNADGSWIQVDYPDLVAGQQAWIAAFLLEIEAREAPAESETGGMVLVMAGADFSGLFAAPAQAQPTTAAEETEEAAEETTEAPDDEAAEITEEAPAAAPAQQTVSALESGRAQAIPNAETRWYAMNLGLVIIIAVIVIGTLVNIVRALLRRGK